MIIDVLPVTGSPRGISPNDIYNRGVGGSELFIMQLLEKFGRNGYKVRYYNDPPIPKMYGSVEYLPNYAFETTEIDDDRIIFLFRGYDERIKVSKYKKVIGISTDQYTVGNYAIDFYPAVDKMVGISEFHKKDHYNRYGNLADKMTVIDIGSDEMEYSVHLPKVENQCLFSSVPDRGLDILLNYWPDIKNKVPNLKLIITSDYRLWGNQFPDNDRFVSQSRGLPDIEFLGKVPRDKLIKLQLESEALLYPNRYDENFCISVSEAQMGGCYVISSNNGALKTTNFTGVQCGDVNHGEFKNVFINEIVKYFSLSYGERMNKSMKIKEMATSRFSWKNIFPKWLELINE